MFVSPLSPSRSQFFILFTHRVLFSLQQGKCWSHCQHLVRFPTPTQYLPVQPTQKVISNSSIFSQILHKRTRNQPIHTASRVFTGSARRKHFIASVGGNHQPITASAGILSLLISSFPWRGDILCHVATILNTLIPVSGQGGSNFSYALYVIGSLMV